MGSNRGFQQCCTCGHEDHSRLTFHTIHSLKFTNTKPCFFIFYFIFCSLIHLWLLLQDFQFSLLGSKKTPPPQANNKTKNVQTGGGQYNPQVQGGNKADGGGNINMGPQISGGGGFTIN